MLSPYELKQLTDNAARKICDDIDNLCNCADDIKQEFKQPDHPAYQVRASEHDHIDNKQSKLHCQKRSRVREDRRERTRQCFSGGG